ncbi:MAG: hypothetical protein IT323_13530 [Anaerolineae bacterium]|nr:hypothetical protein [Anaerolineae bacterium]
MAVLPDTDRQRIWRGLMRAADFGGMPNVVKADLKAAVDAADTWVDSNAASYNTALPQPFRNNATSAQKALLLCAVVLMRFNLDLLRRVFGEVD